MTIDSSEAQNVQSALESVSEILRSGRSGSSGNQFDSGKATCATPAHRKQRSPLSRRQRLPPRLQIPSRRNRR